MARKLMRSQLNQVRAWLRQGRTDAWIAHQLDVSASELRDFIRRNDLAADEDASDDVDLRDEIEAEIEATMETEEEEEEVEEEEEAELEGGEEPERRGEDESRRDRPSGGRGGAEEPTGGRRRRRRRRRGGKRAGAGLEATFDHGDTDGFGLWLDPVVETDPVYDEHWKGHRKLEVTIEPDQIIIRRAGE